MEIGPPSERPLPATAPLCIPVSVPVAADVGALSARCNPRAQRWQARPTSRERPECSARKLCLSESSGKSELLALAVSGSKPIPTCLKGEAKMDDLTSEHDQISEPKPPCIYSVAI